MGFLIEKIHALGLSPELQVVIIAASPILELRGAIPYGVWVLKLHPLKVFLLSLLGNLGIIIPLLYVLDLVMVRFEKLEVGKKMIERAKKKGKLIERFELLGLFLFVAIPLPGTGAWTGVLAALVFGIRKHLSIPAISFGVIAAGVIMTLIVSLGPVKGIIFGVLFLAGMSKMLDYITERK